MKVSVIIPTMKGREELLKKLLSTIPSECEVIVVDDEDLLLAAKRNKGAKKATGDYLLFIDDDNELSHFAIEKLLIGMSDKSIGIMGLMACYDEWRDLILDGGMNRNMITGFCVPVNTNKPRENVSLDIYEVDEVSNAFFVHKWIFQSVGGFDEENFPIDLDEADFCKKVKNSGFKIVINPKAVCFHKTGKYSHIPDFRRELNAYFVGRNRVIFQRIYLNALSFGVYFVIFLPVFICFYSISLVSRKKIGMIKPFMKGVLDGLRGRRANKYQKR